MGHPAQMPADLPAPPDYEKASLTKVLPSVAAALGEPGWDNTLDLPLARRAVVILVDGLGWEVLQRHKGHAPFLRKALASPRARQLDTVFPSTTAAALTSLATGAQPSQHGIVGYDVVDPEGARTVNQLGGWPEDLDPEAWQPLPTVLEQLAHRRYVATVSRPKFATSALTRAALRGPDFLPATGPGARVRASLDALKAHRDAVVYLYWDDLDKAGHSHGVNSEKWLAALEELDSAVKRIVAGVAPGTLVLLTADHGMVDVPQEGRIDYSLQPELVEGVALTAGEPRAVQLHFSPEAGPDTRARVVEAWRRAYGDVAWVLTREEFERAGWFGDGFREGVSARAGDVIIAAHGPVAFYDGRRVGAHAFDMVGQHGSLTQDERAVPLLVLAGA